MHVCAKRGESAGNVGGLDGDRFIGGRYHGIRQQRVQQPIPWQLICLQVQAVCSHVGGGGCWVAWIGVVGCGIV